MKKLFALLGVALVAMAVMIFGDDLTVRALLACSHVGLCAHSTGYEISAGTSAAFVPLGIIINQNVLAGIYRSFSSIFAQAFNEVDSAWEKVAMLVPSSGREVSYNWLDVFPKMREWIGDRVIKNLKDLNYTLVNKDWETTVEVDRNDILDDRIGVHSPIVSEMGRAVAAHPNEIVFEKLAAGFTEECFDGQFFFDADHPVGEGTASNDGGGSGTAWYLMDLRRSIKPIIYQHRQAPQFVTKFDPDDENVFWRKKYVYGADSRDVAGFGLWQLAFGSKVTLNDANFKIARDAMVGLKDAEGKPLGIKPTHLVIPTSLKQEAKLILTPGAQKDTETTPWLNEVEIIEVDWL